MISLSLEEINAQSPYEVSYAPNGDFVFANSLNIHYLVSFEECRTRALYYSLLQAVIHDFEQTAEALTNGKP